ncbi:MAG: hypothetical protein ACXVYB_04325 [Arthrobacter sp.]
MGLARHNYFRASARPLLLSVLLALAWLVWGALVWGAGTANAAASDPNPADVLGHAGTSAVDQVPSLAKAVNDSVKPLASQAATNAATVSVTASGSADASGIPVIQAATAPVTGTVSTVADTSSVILSGAADAVSTAVGAATPLLTGTVEVIDPVVGTDLPGVPAPQPSPLPLTDPAAGVSVGDSGQLTVPGPTDAAAPLAAKNDEHAAATGPLAAAPNAVVPSGAVGFSMEQLLRNDFALHGPAEAPVSASPSPGAPDTEELLRLAAVQGQSGSGSPGSGGAGAQASADLADSWSPLRAGDGTRMPAPAQTVAAGPSFDPGSSPD